MKKSFMKSVLAWLIAIVMAVTYVPAAYAAEGKPETVEPAQITTYEEFVEALGTLEELAFEYSIDSNIDDPAQLVINYIRTGVEGYDAGLWNNIAGNENTDFAEYAAAYEEEVNTAAASEDETVNITGLKNISRFTLPAGDYADFGRMFGVIDISYTNKDSINYADAAGLFGEITELMSMADHGGVKGTIEDMVGTITDEYIMADSDEDDSSDEYTAMRSALDGYYIYRELTSQDYGKGMLTDIIGTYFSENLTDEQRAEYYLENRLQCGTSKEDLRDAVYDAYACNSVISTLERNMKLSAAGESLEDLRTAACYAAADYICRLAGDYVEDVENTFYTVTSSEFADLAPGITREIKTAELTDGRKLRYYIATSDITRDDVNLYVNYYNRPVDKDEDGNYIWQLTPVLEQAQAAQEKFGSPELRDPVTGKMVANPDYIENYNVIVSTNTDGFKMTGEEAGRPGGLVVMNGEEIFPVDEDGFFGITKDGKPVIGDEEDYNNIYKGQLAEGIGTFGTILIKDGKIVEDLGTTDFHSRTVVGITGSGKLVMMVLDGRQDSSVGGAYAHLAQIMLEAGCVDAVNLDGGGSTTFVSREPDSDELAVINSPSDGYPRSVGPTMMIVSTANTAPVFDYAVLSSDTNYMTAGSQMQITASGKTSTGKTADIPADAVWAVSDKSIADVTADGMLTALKTGSVEVSLKAGGKTVGQKQIHVVVPDKIKFRKTYLDVYYNEKVTLPVKAYYEGKSVTVNAADFNFTVSNEAAGSVEGLDFAAGSADSKIRKTYVTAAVKAADTVKASIEIRLHNEGHNCFDFSEKTGGNRRLAWTREVSNSTVKDNHIYYAVDTDKAMEASYVLASDLAKLAGSKIVDDVTEVKITLKVDEDMVADYSQLAVSSEFLELPADGSGAVFDDVTNTLTLTLKWSRHYSPENAEAADTVVLITGLRLKAADDAAWSADKTLTVINEGEVSYKYTAETGKEYNKTYKTFTDYFTLVNSTKNGWHAEDGGWRYYEEGKAYTGIHKVTHRINGEVKSLYYDFGKDGLIKGNVKGNIKKTTYTGFIVNADNTYSYSTYGELTGEWVSVGEDWHYFDPDTKKALPGKHKIEVTAQTQSSALGAQTEIITETVPYEFDKTGKVLNGGTWFVNDEGQTYFYYGPGFLCRQWGEKDGHKVYFAMKGYLLRGIVRIREHSALTGMYYMFDADTGYLIQKCEGFVEYKGSTLYYPPEDERLAGLWPEDVQDWTAEGDVLKYGRAMGLQKIDGKYYLFKQHKNGKGYGGMQTGKQTVEHDIDGACKTVTFASKAKGGYAIDKNGKARTDLLHIPVKDPAVKSTCKKMGLTAGSHCGECGEVIVAQHDTAVKAHTYSETEYLQAPTAKKSGGYYRKCTVCGQKKWTEKFTYKKYIKKTAVNLSTDYADKGIQVKWSFPGVKLDGYQIYRSTSKNGTYKLVKTAKSGTKNWTNSGLKTGKRYYYKVRGYKTVNGKKVYTKYSDKDYKYVLSGTNAKYARAIEGSSAVKAKKAVKVSKGIKVTWSKTSGSKCNRYEVWRSAEKNGTYKKIATTKNKYYTDKSGSLKKGKRYYYKIVGYRTFGKAVAKTNKSNAVSAVR